MRRTVGITAGVLAAAVVGSFALSCGDSTAPAPKTWVANLNTGAEQNAAITTGASGTVTFVDRGTSIDWSMTLNNTTNVTVSHIHRGTAANVGTTAGPVIINLFLPNRPPETGILNGFVQGGQITNANNSGISLDSLRVLFNNGNAYANVHTVAFGAGEIRDQIHPVN
jgi:hypothetical protein